MKYSVKMVFKSVRTLICVGLISLPAFLLVIGCDEKEVTADPEIKSPYPTTIEKLGETELAKLRYEYHKRNYFIFTSLNQFGYSDCCEDYGPESGISPPAVLKSLPESQATEMIEKFLVLNQMNTGIDSTSNLTFDYKDYDFLNSCIFWFFRVSNQKIDSLEVVHSSISIILENGKVTHCKGNWYPEIYIPETFNYDREESKARLLNTKMYAEEVQDSVIITENNLNESIVRLVIFPLESTEKIELRIAWEIYIPSPFYYLLYIDVMTGGVIAKECTVSIDWY
jgi:hypothetical protein